MEYRSVSDECHSSFTRDSSFIKFNYAPSAIFYRPLGKTLISDINIAIVHTNEFCYKLKA